MKKILQIVFLLSFVSCQFAKDKKENNDNRTKESVISESKMEITQIPFDTLSLFSTDTIINNYHFLTRQISSVEFEEMYKSKKETSFGRNYTNDFLQKTDSCFYILKLHGDIDTLCNFDDGEYFEKYQLEGFSKKTNTLIFKWKNWEEAHPILLHLNCKNYWILNPDIEISPDKNRLISYSNFIYNPTYGDNELLIYEMQKDSVIVNYSFSDPDFGVFESKWINENTILIKVKRIDHEEFKEKESYYYKMKIKNIL